MGCTGSFAASGVVGLRSGSARSAYLPNSGSKVLHLDDIPESNKWHPDDWFHRDELLLPCAGQVTSGYSMYRVLAILVFLAAAAITSNLKAQIRTAQHPNAPARIIRGTNFRVPQTAPGGFRVIVPRSLPRHGLLVGSPAFPRHFRFSVFFRNSCFTDPFFDPVFCRQFFPIGSSLPSQFSCPTLSIWRRTTQLLNKPQRPQRIEKLI